MRRGRFSAPVRGRRQLTVRTHAPASRILLEGDRAVGVQHHRRGAPETALARKEVLLAAGAIHSPHLLLCSGIGPPQHLRDHGVDVLVPLDGVGENLQDHAIINPSWACPKPVSLNSQVETVRSFGQYLLTRRGPLAAVLPAAGAFVRSSPDVERPDIEFHFVAGWAADLHDYPGRPKNDGFMVLPVLLRPRARGILRLRSAEPSAAPRIDPRLLGHEDDRRTLVRGYRLARRIAEHTSFDALRGEPLLPDRVLDDDDEILEFVRSNVGTTYHPCGTCKMGQGDDAVVDEQLRVRGVADLRVVDASIMPSIVSGNTNAPVIAIAEKAADMIREKRAGLGIKSRRLRTPRM